MKIPALVIRGPAPHIAPVVAEDVPAMWERIGRYGQDGFGRQTMHENWRLVEAQRNGFDLAKALAAADGVFIEVGGPTAHYSVLSEKLPRPLLVSNVTPGLFESTPEGAHLRGRVDFMADGARLPFADASIGAVFASCLNFGARKDTLAEALRVLKPGGLVVWQGTFKEDLAHLSALGFEVMLSSPDRHNTLVLRKPQPWPPAGR